ncbi:hypothetical protein OIU74_025047 [Salix koriyanagi]|uniref:Uncharacterized protein n=1 Tax=Salix koriyanagi TaxID=2511006 RepID=A0A9Q0SCT1_9ROSI|nr:hypothetical protein OIU74_025047 [Salix koriyanagi]
MHRPRATPLSRAAALPQLIRCFLVGIDRLQRVPFSFLEGVSLFSSSRSTKSPHLNYISPAHPHIRHVPCVARLAPRVGQTLSSRAMVELVWRAAQIFCSSLTKFWHWALRLSTGSYKKVVQDFKPSGQWLKLLNSCTVWRC